MPNTPNKPPKQNDELLKGAFEENFVDFLRFLYPNAEEIFDFSKDIEFMDKKLLAIVPKRERKKGKRIAKTLLHRKYDHDRIIRFLIFLKNFLYINDLEINHIFDERIIQLSGGTIDMGIIEIVKNKKDSRGFTKDVWKNVQKPRLKGSNPP